MSRESRIVDLTEQTTELLVRASNALPGVLAVVAAERTAVHIKAQAYDGVRVSGFTTELDDDGHPIPVRHDPVGEHVARSSERSDAALVPIEAAARAVANAVEALVRSLEPHQAGVRLAVTDLPTLRAEAKKRALEEARIARENELVDCCRSCLRIGVQVKYLHQRVVDGDPWKLCRFCYDEHRGTGSLPERDVLERYHSPDGKRRRRVTP